MGSQSILALLNTSGVGRRSVQQIRARNIALNLCLPRDLRDLLLETRPSSTASVPQDIIATFPTDYANFYSHTKSPEDIADFLIMILTYKATRGGKVLTKRQFQRNLIRGPRHRSRAGVSSIGILLSDPLPVIPC